MTRPSSVHSDLPDLDKTQQNSHLVGETRMYRNKYSYVHLCRAQHKCLEWGANSTTQGSGRRDQHYLWLILWDLEDFICPWGFPWTGEAFIDRFPGDFILKHPLYLATHHLPPPKPLPPFKSPSSFPTIVTIAPSPPRLPTSAIPTMQVVRPPLRLAPWGGNKVLIPVSI